MTDSPVNGALAAGCCTLGATAEGAPFAVWCTDSTGAIDVRGLVNGVFTTVLAVAIFAVAGACSWAVRAAAITSALGAAGLRLALTASGFVIDVPRLNVG